MTGGIIDRAYVEIVPEFKSFGSQAKAGVTGAMGQVSSGVKSGLNKIETESKSAFKRIGASAKEAFHDLGGGKIAGLFAVGGVIEFGKKSVETFETVAKESLGLQRVMGGTVKSASEWRGAMQLGGVSNQQFMTSVRVMSKQITQAAVGKSSAFGALGISVKDAQGHIKSMDALLPAISDKFKQMAPGAAKNALAIQLFGRSGLQMLPFLNRGSAGMEELKKKANELGIVIGDKQAAALKKSVAAQREFQAGIQGIQIWVGEKLMPALDQFFEIVSKYIIPGIKQAAKIFGDAIQVLKDFAHWVNENKTTLTVIAGVITTLLLPAIIAFGVAQAVSLGESITLWAAYQAEALVGAAKAVIAYTMTSVAAIAAGAAAVGAFVAMVAGWVLLGVQSLIQAARVAAAWLIAMGPIGLVIAAVIGLVVLIIKNWQKILDFTKAVWKAIVGWITDHWKLIVVLLTGGLAVLVIYIVNHWTAFKNFIVKLWTDVVNFIRDHWKMIVTILTGGLLALVVVVSRNWTSIKQSVANAIDAIVGFVTRLPGRLIAIFNGALGWLLQAGRNIIGGLRNGAQAIWTSVRNWFAGIPGSILRAIQGAGGAFGWAGRIGSQIIGNIKSGLDHAVSAVVNWFKNLPSKILSAIGIKSPPKWAISAGAWIVKGFLKGLGSGAAITKWVGSLAPQFAKAAAQLLGGPGGVALGKGLGQLGIGGGPTPKFNLGSASQAQTYAHAILGAFGWNENQWGPLFELWQHESNWNPTALNPSSGAFGIPQALPASKMASAGADWQTNAATQVRWGMDYIRSVYGNPATAWQMWQARMPHWYGGGLPPTVFRTPTLIGVGERGAERVTVDPISNSNQATQPATAAFDLATLAQALQVAFNGMELAFDADGVARMVTKRQSTRDIKGVRR
jgi:hypothetical protein